MCVPGGLPDTFCSSHVAYRDRLVAQVVGQLQGLLPGDLGDLGEASLGLRWMEDTIDMLISRYSDISDETGLVETQIEDLFARR